ncbi:Peptidase S1C [Artemisia annua]|uniref:Peptidase S1C n=1 Tax=Artemisia annua TaxID=35608 RepID=A0A2U1N336_ARTAN|nr:Peptidase S1C [Artemisia annua]
MPICSSGKTTLSASGIILPSSCDVGLLAIPTSNEPISLVVTVASLIEPFLSPKYRDQMSQVKPELISGAQIDILLEGNAKASGSETLQWLPAELITLVDIPASSDSIQSLIGASAGSLEHSWEVGWSLASHNDGHQPYFDTTQKEGQGSTIKRLGEMLGEQSIDSSLMGKLATRIAVLKLSSRIVKSEIVGMLTRPLRQKGSGAEVQLVIPWEAIVTACDALILPNMKDSLKHGYKYPDARMLPPNTIEKAMSSICLITVGDGVWASGVLLNSHGLILTNAHLLEPWRFKKTAANETHKTVSNIFFAPSNEIGAWPPKKPEIFQSSSNKRNHQSIRVRVDYLDRWIWCDANVLYLSKGPLDIALLQLEFVPDKLQPIVMDFICPSPGSKVYVIGHGLFGPRCDLLPSACVGVVAKVVKAQKSIEETGQDFPAMIETTAAVHPGGSGGAILNSDGHMISLVTSNARHGGGTVIPYLNFSIPCASLEPVFNFSKDMKDLSILKDLDKPNEHLSSVWALMPPVSTNPRPEGDNIKDTKGSSFAKFIAEKQHLFKQTSPPDKMDPDCSKVVPSKL